MSALHSLSLEILQRILEGYEKTFPLSEFVELRAVSYLFDDLVSRIVFPRATRRRCISNRKPLKAPAIKWLLLNTTIARYKDTEGLFSIIQGSAKAIVAHESALSPGQTFPYRRYLDAACHAIIAEYGSLWILQKQLFPKRGAKNPLEEVIASLDAEDDGGTATSLETAMAKGALHLAASVGNAAAVETLLASGADPNLQHPLYGYALSIAAYRGHAQVVELFVRHGADLNVETGDRGTPLSIAAERNRKGVVDVLVKEIRARDATRHSFGHTALLWASRRGWTDTVQSLLAKEGTNADARTPGLRDCPIGSAISSGHLDIVQLLMNRDEVRLTSDYDDHNSPLNLAIKNGSPEIIRLLMEKLYLPDEIAKTGSESVNPLVWAIDKGEPDMINLMLSYEVFDINSLHRERWCEWLPLEKAVALQHVPVVQMLLELPGIDPNRHAQVMTPLGSAIFRRNLEITRLLLDHPDTNINLLDENGLPPLFEAISNGNTRIAGELTDRPSLNVNLCVKTGDGVNPLLLLAYQHRAMGIVDLLLAREDIDVNQTGTVGSILFLATERDDVDLIQTLLQREDLDVNQVCSINIRDRYTAFLRAAKQDNVMAFEALLQDGRTDLNAVDGHGRSALWWVAFTGRIRMVDCLLMNRKTNVNLQDKEGWTPLFCAVTDGDRVVVESLLNHPDIDPNLAKEDGWTPLHQSTKDGDTELLHQLMNHPKIDIWARTNDGMTAVDIAKAENQEMTRLEQALAQSVDPQSVPGKS